MKKVISTLLIVFAVTVFTGCKRNYTVYERHDITACGVKDPLVNLPWLAEECEKAKKAKNGETTISLLQDTVTKDNVFKLMYYYKNKEDIYIIYGYNCSGKELYRSGLGLTPPDSEIEEEFYKNKKHLGIIFKTKYK
ncbi:hypothetical protein HMPREF0156_01576 [Bacteroidetes oral taxon 274 str. F0058]|nr:hypothetical protein HMPREF0156_01576 [Bacteroidetes oral taxon 274 str. F0058]